MHRGSQEPPAVAGREPQPVAAPDHRQENRVTELTTSFGQTWNTLGSRTWTIPGFTPFWVPYPRHPGLGPQGLAPRLAFRGRSFHTSYCYGPPFPNEPHAVMQPREAAASVKRSWEDDGRAAYSADRNCGQRGRAEKPKRHHRSKSYDETGRGSQRRGLFEGDLCAEMRRLRRWEYTDFGRVHEMRPESGVEFTVATYNVLAQCLLEDNSYLYQHCDPEVLSWEFRKGLILGELTEANADVLCLQEIQNDHYEDFFVPELGKLGYTGRYKKRTGDKNDGCAIFFKNDLFSLDDCTSVEYSRPGLSLLDRDNIALVAMLRPRRRHSRSSGKVCVVNTHLLFNPGRGDIKLAQLQILLAEIDRFAYRGLSSHSRRPLYHPVIMCGDMNSEPNCSLYEFVSTGALQYEGLMAGDISGQADGCRKGRFALKKELIPEQLGISDQCQYVDTISKRMVDNDDRRGDCSETKNDGQQSGNGRTGKDKGHHGEDGRQSGSAGSLTRKAARDDRPVTDEICFGLQPESHVTNNQQSGNDQKREKLAQKDGRPAADEICFGLQPESHPDLQRPAISGTVADYRQSGNGQRRENINRVDDRPAADEIRFGLQTENHAELQGTANSGNVTGDGKNQGKFAQKDDRPSESGSKDTKDGQSATDHQAVFATGTMTHGLNFVSAYGHRLDRSQGRYAAVTTHHRRGSCMVDYIFYTVRSKDTRVRKMDRGQRVEHRHRRDGPLSLLATHGLMSCGELNRLGGLPNSALPSDHLKLMAKFLLREDS